MWTAAHDMNASTGQRPNSQQPSGADVQTRRDFVISAAFAGGAVMRGLRPGLAGLFGSAGTAAEPLDLLVLGGTGFIGPYLVRYAVGRGHRVTIFTRGRHQAELPPQVMHLE